MGNLLEKIIEKPEKFCILLLSICIFFGFSLLLAWSLLGENRESLEVALIAFGVATILIIMLRTENAIAVSASVIIVGTVVASDRFILTGTCIVYGKDLEECTEAVGSYDSVSSIDRKSAGEFSEEELIAIQRIIELEMGTKASEGDRTSTIIQNVVGSARLERLTNEVRELGASTPLQRLNEGQDAWDEFARNFGGQQFFIDDMESLERLGLVELPGKDVKNASITDSGRSVAEKLSESPFLRAVEDALVPDGPSLEEAAELELDGFSLENSPLAIEWKTRKVWLKLDILQKGTYTIETSESGSSDPALTLYDYELSQLDEADDEAGGFNALMEIELNVGNYLLLVENLDAFEGSTRVTLEQN